MEEKRYTLFLHRWEIAPTVYRFTLCTYVRLRPKEGPQ